MKKANTYIFNTIYKTFYIRALFCNVSYAILASLTEKDFSYDFVQVSCVIICPLSIREFSLQNKFNLKKLKQSIGLIFTSCIIVLLGIGMIYLFYFMSSIPFQCGSYCFNSNTIQFIFINLSYIIGFFLSNASMAVILWELGFIRERNK